FCACSVMSISYGLVFASKAGLFPLGKHLAPSVLGLPDPPLVLFGSGVGYESVEDGVVLDILECVGLDALRDLLGHVFVALKPLRHDLLELDMLARPLEDLVHDLFHLFGSRFRLVHLPKVTIQVLVNRVDAHCLCTSVTRTSFFPFITRPT